LAVEVNQPKAAVESCVDALTHLPKTTFDGHPAFEIQEGGPFVLVENGLLLIGDPDPLKDFFARAPRDEALVSELALSKGEIAKVKMHGRSALPDTIESAVVTLFATESEMGARATAKTAGDAIAAGFVGEIQKAVADFRKMAGNEKTKPFLDAVSWKQDGANVILETTVKGDAAAQQDYLWGGISLAQALQHDYLLASHAAEAKSAVGVIARALVSYTEQEEATGKVRHKFPPSAPRVPRATPKGAAVTTESKDWQHASWKAIHFEMPMPQRYSYEFVTSKDGKKCTVKAHGDLNGDGKESLFEVDLEIDKSGVAKIAPLREKDPRE
jgi:hypothetical protein